MARGAALRHVGIARAGILALIGMLTASFFLSNLDASQFWAPIAVGPALAGIAERQARRPPQSERLGGLRNP